MVKIFFFSVNQSAGAMFQIYWQLTWVKWLRFYVLFCFLRYWEKINAKQNWIRFLTFWISICHGTQRVNFPSKIQNLVKKQSDLVIFFLSLSLHNPLLSLCRLLQTKSLHADTKSFVWTKAVVPVCTRSALQTLTTCRWHQGSLLRRDILPFQPAVGTDVWKR